jgi:hypothetical protein
VQLGRRKRTASSKKLGESIPLSGKEETIKILLEKKVGISATTRILVAYRLTLAKFIISRHLK